MKADSFDYCSLSDHSTHIFLKQILLFLVLELGWSRLVLFLMLLEPVGRPQVPVCNYGALTFTTVQSPSTS